MLPISLIEENKCVAIPDASHSFLLEHIAWLNGRTPWFPYPGRVAWALLPEPVKSQVTGRYYSSVKLKGVGVWSPSSWDSYSGLASGRSFEVATPPTIDEYSYIHTTPHIGFDVKGKFVTKYSDVAAYGGLTLNRALQEYRNGLELYDAKVSVSLPILVTQYEGRQFNGYPLASVISLLPSPYPYRLDSVIYNPESSEPLEHSFLTTLQARVYETLESQSRSPYELVSLIYGIYGQELHRFSMAGFFRHSGGINNCYFDMETCRSVLTDFDSSKHLADLDECVRALEVIRDAASVLYKIIFRQLHPRALQIYDILKFRNHDPIQSFLASFLAIERDEILESIGDILWDYSLRAISIGSNNQKDVGFVTQSSASNAGFSKLEFFTYAVLLISIAYHRSALNAVYTLTWSFDKLLENASGYIGNESVQLLVAKMRERQIIAP